MTAREPDGAEDEQRRQRAPVSDGLDWTDRAGMAAQQRSALNAVKANERAAADPRAGKTLKFSEDRRSSPKPVTKPERESGEKRLKFFEDKKPDKDIDRDR